MQTFFFLYNRPLLFISLSLSHSDNQSELTTILQSSTTPPKQKWGERADTDFVHTEI